MLIAWSTFFTLTGSAGATLVGLLFIVVTLNTDLSTSRTLDIARASMTPALYSFGGVMVQGMIAVVPWKADWHGGVIFVLIGIGGLAYRLHAVRLRNALHLQAIRGLVDRVFHNAAPVVSSVLLTLGGAGLIAGSAWGPFAVAVASAILIISGIYRTWGETLALIGTRGKS